MKRFKRIVGLLLCLAMVLSIVPVTHTHVHVHAAETGTGRLEIIPASEITPDVGTYTGASRTDWTRLSSYSSSEAALLINLNTANKSYLYSGALSSNQVAAAVLSWSGTKTIGAVELAANPTDHATEFSIEYMDTNGTWQETGVEVTSDPFTSKRTQLYTFDYVEAKAVRIIVFDDTGNNHFSFTEAYVYEVNDGTPLKQIPLTNASFDKSSNGGTNVAANVIDGDLQTGYDVHYNALPATFTAAVSAGDDIPTTVSKVEIHPLYKVDNGSPKSVTISLYVDGEWVSVYEGTAYTSSSTDLFVYDLDQSYSAEQIRVKINSANYVDNAMAIAEIRVYGPDPNASTEPGELGTTTVGTPSMQELNLEGTTVGACSRNSADLANADGSIPDHSQLTWWFPDVDPSKDPEWLVDNNSTTEIHWGVSSNERADIYLDLTKNYGSGTTVDGFELQHSKYGPVPRVRIYLVLTDNTTEMFEYSTNWQTSTAGSLEVTFDQTYNVKGVYLWEPDNKSGSHSAAFGELTLYQKKTVQLPTPKNLQTTEVTDTSITVAANTVSAGGKLQFSKDGSEWFDAVGYSYTFTGLSADTDYTIQARYFATADGYVTTATPATIEVTTEEATKEPLAAPTIESVTTTDSTITVNATAAAGTLMYRVVLDGNEVRTWQTDNVFTGLNRNTGYDVEVKCVPTDNNYAESEVATADATTAKTKLPRPAVLEAIEVTDTSITVTADTNPNGTLYFRRGLGDVWGEWTTNPTFTDLQPETEYVIHAMYEPIGADFERSDFIGINVTTSTCAHKYDNVCTDTVCNVCGEERVAPGHTYDNACDVDCNVCDEERTPADHVYDNACDADCNVCGATRVPADHVYDNEYDASCNVCGHTRIVVYPEIPGLTEMENVPAPVIGYYTDTNGAIKDAQSAPNIVDDNTGNYAASQYFTHEEAANGTKVPAILFTFDSAVTLGAIEIWGYEAYRYNMEDFEVQVYVDGAWKTVTATVDAFHVDGAKFGDDLTGDNQWLKLYFDKVYSTTQLRILVSGMSDMSEDADEVNNDGSTNEELYTGSYIRVREIKLYESECEHAFDNCDDTDCNNGCGYTRAPIAHSYSDCEDTTCDNDGCNETRVAPGHAYSNDCDTTCNNGCGHIREVPDHVYDNACDESCNVCGEMREVTHNYDNGCDTECNDCGAIRDAEHTYDNDCDADCNECGYLRPDATGHKYDNNCDTTCSNCGFVRTAPHTFNNCEDEVCAVCGEDREPTEHVYTNECDPDCNICDYKPYEQAGGVTHKFDSNCDDSCSKCGTVREAPHRYSSIYDTDCEDCGAVRTAQAEPDLPVYADKAPVELSAPIFGYYANGDTNGTITNWYEAGYGPDKLVDGTRTEKSNHTRSLYYNYKEIQQGIKTPVILFQFAEPTNVCAVDIYGYAYSYYNMETFDVQVYTNGAWVNVAHVTNAFTDGEFEEQVTEALTVTFDKAYEATQLRILVRKVTNMLGRGDVTTGDDDFGFSAPFRVKEIEIYSTTSEPIEHPNEMILNGTDIGDYRIVYTDELDYNLRAAEYLKTIIYKKTGRELMIVEDNVGASDYEILVGDTNRSLSTAWDAPDNQAMKFHIRADGKKIVLEAEYFIIAGAAYYFGEKFVPTDSETEKTVPAERTALDPIIEPANNYIMMIGDGMGVNQTKLFDVYNVPTSGTYDFSDGEDIFYGYYFPYEGRSRTWNVLGQITDSAAGGTALSTGYKTTNGTVGLNWYGKPIKNLSELAVELGMSVAVMSTEGADGATPASFSAHTTGRYDSDIVEQQKTFAGLLVDGYVNYSGLTAAEWADWEEQVLAGLNSVSKDPDGFFVMYEEAHIDKYLHQGKSDEVFRAVYRFNQAIGIFMEYAMYNPDTVVLITADHETGGIELGAPNSGNVAYNTPNPPDEAAGSSKWNHSEKDVPVFAYGFGMEVFDTDINAADGYYENASIGRTYAHFMTNGHADDFGDPWYPILVKGTTPEEYPEDPMKVTDKVEHAISISGKVTGGYSQTVSNGSPAEITINLTNANGTPTNVKKMIISAANTTSAAPATTIVEAQVEVDGELIWLQIYKDTLYGVMYGEAMTSGVLDFHTSYNAYQIRITVNSLNTTGGYGTMNLSSIALYGYNVVTPDVGGVITDGGNENEDAVIQLMQGDEVKYTATIAGNNYYVMDVASGDYTVVATKSGHITVEYDITVGSDPVRQDVVLKYVAESTITATSQSVRLIEPWAIRSYIQYAEDANSTDPVYLTSILGYGAYGIIEHKTGDTTPTSWEDIIYNEKAIKFEKSFTEGDEKISHTSNAGRNRRYTVMFDFYDMLYTYRMAEQVYWVTFYEDAEGIHFTNVYHISMSELIDTIKAKANPSDTEEAVLDDMKTLHQELIEYRGADANLGNTPYPQGVKLSESGIKFEDVNTGSWQFGRRRQIRLIEPWGFKVTLRFKNMETNTIIADPNATAADYGMIFFHDKIDRYVNNGMSFETMLAQGDALVFSKSLNNMIVDGDSVLAIYTKDIYTYQLDSELYCLPFIKIGNQYHVPQNAVCWNLLEEMETIRDDTVNRVEKERDVLAAMVDLYYDITKHLGFDE